MKNSKILIAICLILSIMMTLASCDLLPLGSTEHECSDANKDHKCDVCSESMGKHADANKDHVCDYGCSQSIGVCEDIDLDHVCDYGCALVIGECADADLDHTCDYGCGKLLGECADADKDHSCDYGCGKSFGECADADFDHACDYGCDKTYGEHADADIDHACDYGCSEGIGECSDEDKDHACDYGCSIVIGEHADADLDHACDYGCAVALGEHADADKNHVCDYGCAVEIGTCEDADLDHACDYGCDKAYGEHADADLDHACDYGCTVALGEHADSDKNHACDYGCSETFGECVDADFDHDCDYGCSKVYGECADADFDHDCDYGCSKVYGECADTDLDHDCDYGCDKVYGECVDADFDHDCDYGCSKVYGEHSDSADDNDHLCDYGCKAILEDCSDVLTDGDHACDVCGADDITSHVYGEWDKNDADTHKQTCNCGSVVTENHQWNDGVQIVAPNCTEDGLKSFECVVCHETKTESVDALGHDIINHEAQEPTCSAIGWDAYETCSRCSYSTKVEKEMLSHSFGWIVDQQPTLDADGIKHEECSVCGEKRNENTPIDKLTCNHPEMTKIDAVAATCLNDGNKEYYFCSGCNKYYSNVEGTLETTVEENVISALGHDMVTDKAVAPDCENTGLTEGSHCSRCDYKIAQEEVAALGHDMVTDKAVAPDCENTGLTEGSHCSRCDHKVAQKEVPALGHDMLVDEAVAPDCLNNGLTEGSHCSRCDHKVAQEIAPALGHNLVTSDAVAPTCMNTGLTAGEYCTRCDYKVEQDVLPVVGHIDADGDKHCDYNGCDVVYYELTVDGVSVVASSDRSSAYPNAYLPGTEFTLVANTYKDVDDKIYMLVGFDLNTVDNRLTNDGSSTVTYTMPAADTSITARYAEANTTFFANASWQSGSNYNPEGMSATLINNSTDPDLEGLSGWSFTIADNTAKTTSKTNNVTAAPITAWGIDNEKLVRFVLKNTGDYDVTVELYGEYFGYVCSTGNVTVPANSVVVAFMDFGPFSGAGTTCDFGIHVREDMTGDGSGTIQLDVVAATAKKYETKVSDFIVTSDKNVFMDFGESNESNTQANVAHASASGMNMRYWDQYGVMYFYGNNNTSDNTYARERGNALGGEAIHLQNGEKFTIYVKVTNLYHAGGGKYSLVFTRGSSSLSGSYLATQTIEFSEYGESHVYKIEIDPSKAGSSDNLQFGLKKAKADGTGGKVNVLVQIASENIFGEEPVNQ